MEISQNTQIGLFLTCLGLVFIFLGIVLLFDRGLLAIGNVSKEKQLHDSNHYKTAKISNLK